MGGTSLSFLGVAPGQSRVSLTIGREPSAFGGKAASRQTGFFTIPSRSEHVYSLIDLGTVAAFVRRKGHHASWIAASIIGMLSTGLSAHSTKGRRNGPRILSGFYFSASLLTNSTMRFLTTSGSTLTPNIFESKRTPDGVASCRATKSFPFCSSNERLGRSLDP